jgi:hypothetical protein
MKIFQSVAIGSILSLSNTSVTTTTSSHARNINHSSHSSHSSHPGITQSTVTASTDADGRQIQSTTVSVDRADLTQPHILRIEGFADHVPDQIHQIQVRVNGRVIKSGASNLIALNLSPILKSGRYVVEILGISPRSNDTIRVSFTGKNTNVMQQFSGTGLILPTLVIDIQ